MKAILSKLIVAATVASPLSAALVHAQPAPSQAAAGTASAELSKRVLQGRAVEATVWGMPAVSMAALRKSLKRDLDANYGDVVYFSKVMEPRHEFLTANNQTPYVLTFFDLRQGPVVLDVPPASPKVAFFGSAIDSWQVPLADIGPTGEDAGKGGKYLFLPPGFTGTPPKGYIVVPSQTFFIHVGLRPIAVGSGTQQDAVAYSQQLKTYPLADAANPKPSRYVDAYPKAWKTLPTYDIDYLRLLAEVVEVEPALPRDAAMLGMLTEIGIAKGTPFNPDAERARILGDGVREAAAYMQSSFMNDTFVPFWPNRQWSGSWTGKTFEYTYFGDGKLNYDRRAVAFAYWATWAPKRLGQPGKLPASYYLKGFRDQSGALFRGDRLYRVRIPADTPARDFWAIVAYDIETNAFIHNPQNRVGVSSYDKKKMVVNSDGSTDVYIGPKAPEKYANNWIPTAGKDFWLIARFYGPEKQLFDKTWVMPDVEEVK